jgi:internalin A
MTSQQRSALASLGRLTELGRNGGDPSAQCVYKVGGKENGIQLFQMGVTDADMRHFDRLPEWHAITIRECPVGDAGLKHLSNQTGLRFLDIGQTGVTTLHPIKGCIHLRQLWCDALGEMTDRKAAALSGFRELVFLDLAWTGISDATVKRLAALTELRKLNLVGTKISDEGLRAIGALPNLEVLSLYRTAVTDEGLANLHGLPNLRFLAVGETPVTKKGKTAIRRACPDLKVEEYFGVY